MEPILLRPSEAAALINVSRSVIYELIHLPAPIGLREVTLSIGKSKRILRSGLEAWLEAKCQEAQRAGQAEGPRLISGRETPHPSSKLGG